MLLESDRERLDEMFDAVFNRRKERGYVPERNEERIAEILADWDRSAAEEHDLLMESKRNWTVKAQPAASRSSNLKQYPTLNRWKRR